MSRHSVYICMRLFINNHTKCMVRIYIADCTFLPHLDYKNHCIIFWFKYLTVNTHYNNFVSRLLTFCHIKSPASPLFRVRYVISILLLRKIFFASISDLIFNTFAPNNNYVSPTECIKGGSSYIL